MTEWKEIAIAVDDAIADEVAGALAGQVGAAAAGLEVRTGEIVLWAPGELADSARAEVAAALAALAASGMAVDAGAVAVRAAAPEAEWRDAWKRYFHVERLTPRIVIVPSWERHTPGPDDVVIDLDPGQAFGTGAHASTQLCLLELDELARVRAVARFCDLGTGSGILAIAAAKLWPGAHGVAVDEDPLAVGVATDNAAANRVADQVTCVTTPIADLDGRFDLVVANIQADVLGVLREAVTAHVSPGGHLVLSGLLTPQAAQVGLDYAGGGFDLEEIRTSARDPEWSAVRLRRLGA